MASFSCIARLGRCNVKLHFTAEEVVGVESSQQDIGVGHRRFRAAAAVAGGTRHRACALRANPQRIALADARDAAAAGADFEDIHHRDLDRQRLLVAADQRAPGRQRLAVADHASLRRRAAHIEGDGVLQAELRADGLRADHTSRRAGLQHADAIPARMLDGKQAAGRLHDEEIAAEALLS